MRIEITRSGGFGGVTRSWSLDVSRTEAEQRWLPLAAAEAGTDAEGPESDATGASRRGAAPQGGGVQRDRFTYRIAIGYTEVYLSESHLGDPWRELIERARAAAAPGAPAAAATPVPGSTERTGPVGDADPGKPEELL
ncbi:protealysin inhibitor emfourin [Arthrobacter sp. B0490]|uniref:protealysin inhibitor emfourin n=1 Tax=Arthrobacter sp. B0490 TaxID=2058891 RepID=UPI000CE2F21E|nr:protealysin inhibitor emfourin [Arthrobacter sp. B0490]